MKRMATKVAAAMTLCSLMSCEWMAQQRAYWNSPEGKRVQAMQMNQMGMQMVQNQNQVYLQQQQHLHERSMALTPRYVHHSGSLDVNHSDTITVRNR